MKSVKVLRIISVIILAAVLLGLSLSILLPVQNDAESEHVAVFFVDEDRLFPQMDYHQMMSGLDIPSYYSVGEKLDTEGVSSKVGKISDSNPDKKLILVGEGRYTEAVLKVAAGNQQVECCIVFSPVLSDSADLSTLGTKSPASKVAIFSPSAHTADRLYEHLSGEDTRYTSGMKKDTYAPELYLSPDAMRYYARISEVKNEDLASAVALNSPIVQTYMADYITNHILGRSDVSRAPLANWSVKVIFTVLTLVAFFLFGATIPEAKKITDTADGKSGSSSSGKDARAQKSKDPSDAALDAEAERARRLRGRTLFEKYHASLNHLSALQLLLGGAFGVAGCLLVAISTSSVKKVMLVWLCVSFLSSAFFLLKYIRKVPRKVVRTSRSMWMLQVAHVILLLADIFLLMLLWRGAGFLKPDIFILISLMLSVMLAVAVTMLNLTDTFFLKSEKGKGVLDSLKFYAIRFVPMVIVFSFSIIMKKEMCAIQMVILMLAVFGAELLRKLYKRGALGETLSVFLFAALYFMMF